MRVLFVEAMKTWTSALWFGEDVATHSIVYAFNAGFLNAEEKAVRLVEQTTMNVDNFKLRDLKNYKFTPSFSYSNRTDFLSIYRYMDTTYNRIFGVKYTSPYDSY
jgi:hypothetical protein